MNEHELRVLRALTTELRALHQEIHAICEQRNAAGRSEKPEPQQIINSVVSLPPAVIAHYETEQREKPRRERRVKFKRGAEYFGIILLGIYTLYTIKMYSANKDAADAAKIAANTARDTFRLTYRPRLRILGITPTVQSMVNGKLQTTLDKGRLRVSIDLPNLGPFDARNVQVFRYDNVSTRERIARLPYGTQLSGLPQLIPPKAEGGFSSRMTIVGERIITPEELSRLRAGTLWATFSVLVSYDDDFGDTHHVEYCDLFTLQPYNDICPWRVRND